MTARRPSLRLRLLVDLGFLMAAAVMIVGLTTLVLVGADIRDVIGPLASVLGAAAAIIIAVRQ